MAHLLRMPEAAADANEAVLGSWSMPPGTAFRAGAVLATIETAKAVVDIEADTDGVLVRILVDEGGEVAVGAALALLAAPGEDVGDVDAELAVLTAASPAPEVGRAAPPESPPQRVFISPLARRLARDAGIPVDRLRGTGPNNRIVRRDVEAAIAAANHAVPDEQNPAYVDEPHSRLRAAIAANLTRSKQSAPHFYLRATADVGALAQLRAELNASPGTRISLNDLVVKAVAIAHTRVPGMNVVWTDAAVRRFASVDLAVAVATERGLVTPVVRSVETLSIRDLAAANADLAVRARAGSLRPHELEGGSATVSNLGMFGTEEFAAIINPPQSAVLAVGAAREAPVARDGVITAATVMTLTASVDHRPIDGALAARWMDELVGLLESPAQLLP
ncbi:MAG: dihydrolipoamide acetyltransferase family protein [Jatrophihabitantaceae bacterium]